MSLRAALHSGFLLLALLLTSVSAAVSAAPKILVLGDSISAAYGMSLHEGWVALLDQRLASAGTPVEIVNASISGETTDGGRRRLPGLLDEHAPDAVIIELGGNDGLRGYPADRLRDNLISMVESARQAGARVLVLPMEIPPNYGSRYASDFRNSFPVAAESTGARLGPFLLEGIATDTDLMQPDGIHPTRDAQSMIVDALLADVVRLLQE